ncbi:hypothetical protein F5Y18DRAFT_295361 [Xylariaceae sp. FL1019]|nr:hypothetical protein F5Y18DRAFT_295361 [Xylariaceae sp. FL1019]
MGSNSPPQRVTRARAAAAKAGKPSTSSTTPSAAETKTGALKKQPAVASTKPIASAPKRITKSSSVSTSSKTSSSKATKSTANKKTVPTTETSGKKTAATKKTAAAKSAAKSTPKSTAEASGTRTSALKRKRDDDSDNDTDHLSQDNTKSTRPIRRSTKKVKTEHEAESAVPTETKTDKGIASRAVRGRPKGTTNKAASSASAAGMQPLPSGTKRVTKTTAAKDTKSSSSSSSASTSTKSKASTTRATKKNAAAAPKAKVTKPTKASKKATGTVTTGYATKPTPGLKSAVSRTQSKSDGVHKKSVTFQEPDEEEDEISLPAPVTAKAIQTTATKTAESAADESAATETGMRAKPVRKATTSARATRAATRAATPYDRPATKAAAKGKKVNKTPIDDDTAGVENELPPMKNAAKSAAVNKTTATAKRDKVQPLSPRKDGPNLPLARDVREPSSDDELATYEKTPIKSSMKSPVRAVKGMRKLELLPVATETKTETAMQTTNTDSVETNKLELVAGSHASEAEENASSSVGPVAIVHSTALTSPAHHPSASPQKMLQSPAKRLPGDLPPVSAENKMEITDLGAGTHASETENANSSVGPAVSGHSTALTSPARRPASPPKSLQSPAKRAQLELAPATTESESNSVDQAGGSHASGTDHADNSVGPVVTSSHPTLASPSRRHILTPARRLQSPAKRPQMRIPALEQPIFEQLVSSVSPVKSSLLQSPAKRYQQALPTSDHSFLDQAGNPPSPTKGSHLQSPAKRPASPVKLDRPVHQSPQKSDEAAMGAIAQPELPGPLAFPGRLSAILPREVDPVLRKELSESGKDVPTAVEDQVTDDKSETSEDSEESFHWIRPSTRKLTTVPKENVVPKEQFTPRRFPFGTSSIKKPEPETPQQTADRIKLREKLLKKLAARNPSDPNNPRGPNGTPPDWDEEEFQICQSINWDGEGWPKARRSAAAPAINTSKASSVANPATSESSVPSPSKGFFDDEMNVRADMEKAAEAEVQEQSTVDAEVKSPMNASIDVKRFKDQDSIKDLMAEVEDEEAQEKTQQEAIARSEARLKQRKEADARNKAEQEYAENYAAMEAVMSADVDAEVDKNLVDMYDDVSQQQREEADARNKAEQEYAENYAAMYAVMSADVDAEFEKTFGNNDHALLKQKARADKWSAVAGLSPIPEASQETPATSPASEASQEYGDENIPLDPLLFNDPNARQSAGRSFGLGPATPTPARALTSGAYSTVTKVALKPAQDSPPQRRKRLFGYDSDDEDEDELPPPSKRQHFAHSSNVSLPDIDPSRYYAPYTMPANPVVKSDRPLVGVVAYVEVYTEADRAWAGDVFQSSLVEMGAKVVKQWTWHPIIGTPAKAKEVGITHVIFKAGNRDTLLKVAMSDGLVQCVGCTWVLDCLAQREHLSEDSYRYDVQRGIDSEPPANSIGTLVTPARDTTRPLYEPQTAPDNAWNRRTSAYWVRSPSDHGDAMDWEPTAPLTPVPQTPAPETVAQFALDITPGTASTTSVGDMSPESPMLRTCPPKPKADDLETRLATARRRSLAYAPATGSPLKKSWF